eukprot:3858214-Lingulodinium_polyedra.AAC.1
MASTITIRQAAQGKQCGRPLDRRCHHADVCNSAGRQRTHTAVRRVLSSALSKAGAWADEEQ